MSGKKTINNTTPAIGAIKIQQSTYGVVIPIVWGRTRVSGNLIWYGDFKSVPHTEVTQQGGKGGGGAPQQTTTTYTYQASVAMALCEGPVLGVRTAWRGKNIYEGSTYSGSTRSSSETRTIPTGGARTVTVSNTNGWVPVSVELRVSNDFDDGFRYNRRGSWMTLTPGDDFTASAGVYTFGGGDAQPGDTVRITYTYVSNIPSFSCLAQIGLDLFNGTPGQQPWTYLSSRHPDQALGYSGIAYVAGANYSLDGSASVENHAFEVETSFMTSASVPDADPSLIAADALTNPQYGAQFGREKLGDMSDYSKACLAQGIVLSPALTEQMSASAFLDQLSGMTNVGLVWSGGALKFIPYTDMPVTGNGVTFTPITTPIYDLTDDDFQPVDDEGPVKVNRGAVSDSFNSVKLEYFDRANDYNIAIMEQADQADIQENGPRPMPVMTAHWITEAAVAKIVATLVLQRSLFIRNTYEFKLGWTKIALEPMDLVTITDPNLGMDKLPVRILSIEESDDGYLSVVAEDFPKGSASATLYPSGSGGGFTPNFNEPPGAPLAPVIFEGPSALANSEGGLEVWLATGSTSPTYGGCEVWVSLTGSDYRRAATLNGKSRFGVTTGILPAAQVGATTTDSLGVQLSSGGQLLAATATDMAALVTLCYVGGEFFSYETSTLTGASAYTLGGHMVRGAYLSNSAAHASGSAFVRCDDAIAKVQLTPDYIGRTIHIKLLPFNRYGGAVGSLSDATEYTYTVSGLQANQAPIAPRNLGVEGPFTATTAKFRWDRIGNAASYNVQVWAGSPAAKVREVNVGDSLRYDYSAADAKSDGGPWRTLTVKVQGIHANGAVGAFSTFTATNPQVGALTGVAAASGPRTVQFACDRPSDADYSGILVWLSATSGFTPDASTLVFDGPDTNVTINRLKGGAQLALGATYYVRAAAYDSYDKNGLTISPEVAVVIENTTGVQTAIIQLYKWSTAAPAKPTGSSTFTWATGANAGYAAAPADGWLVAPGSNPGTPGASLWIATVQIAVPTGTTTSTVDYTNSTVGAWSQNGMNGSSGVNNGAATVFRWSATVPQGPAGAATYKWSDGSFGAAPTSPDGSVWGLTSGAPPSAGMTLWAAKVTVVDSAANAQTGFNWSSAAIMAIGTAGSNGQAGASYVTAYCASATGAATSAPAATTGKASLPATNSGGITGAWSAAVPTLANNQYLYQSDGIYDPATDKVTWSTPYWSSLKVGTLSAISANLGAITGGSLNIGNGKFTVDASGNVTMSSFLLVDPNTGKTILQAGGVVSVDFLPTSVKNSELVPSINAAATTANWDTGITGTKKPQDNATVGADATNLNVTVGGDNLTFNSSFERVSNGYLADGWNVYNNGGANEPTTAYKAPGRTGANAQGISWVGAHSTTKGIHGQINSLGWIPGKTYTVAFWAMTTNISEPLGLSLQWNTWPASTVEVSNPAVVSSWQRYVFRITWGGSVEGGGHGYVTIANGSSSGNVIFDDFMVVEGDVAPAYYPSAAEAATIATGVTVNPDGSLNNAGGGKPTLPGMGQNVYRVVARGLQANTGPAAGLWKNGAVALGAKRSYFVAMIRRSDGVIEAGEYFDVYGNGEAANGRNAASMATMLNGYGSDYIAIVWTYDEPYVNRLTAGLEAAMYRCGASRAVYGSPQFKLNSAYVLIGVPGCGEGNGAEAYQGSVNNDPNAWVEMTMTLVNGAFTVSPGYTPRTLTDYGYVGDMNATKGAPAGTYVGSDLAENVQAWAIQGLNAAQALPAVQSAIADRISKSAGGILQGPITLSGSGGISVGSLTWDGGGYRTGGQGVAITPYGIIAHNGSKYTFAFNGSDGSGFFGGELQAAYGSFGRLTVASNGSLSTPNYTGWVWPTDGSTGFYLGTDGLMLGNPITGQWFKVSATGAVEAPGLDYKNGLLTLTSPVLVNPKTQTSFSASMSSLILTNQVNTNTYQNYSRGPVISGGTAASYLWSFDAEQGDIRMTSDPTSATANIQARGSNAYTSGWLSVTVRDVNGATATASCRVAIQFGSGVAQ